MTPDETWRVLELFDYLTAAIIEVGIVIGVLVGIGYFLSGVGMYHGSVRRTFRKWRKKNLEEK